MSILALDIGGTAVKYGYFSDNAIFGEFPVKDPLGNENIPKKLVEFIAKYDTDYIGISIPGPFDFETGTSFMEHKLKSLYKISLKDLIAERFPHIKLVFLHDSTAFIFGAILDHPQLSAENIAGVMIGTGLGYIQSIRGRVLVNRNKTPIKSIWNMAFKNGIAENYVSSTAIIKKSKHYGYYFENARDVAEAARNDNKQLSELFFETGKELGELIKVKQYEDGFERLIIGGQVSRSWDLMYQGFESICKIPYQVVSNPAQCALYGIKYCIEKDMKGIYLEGIST